MEIFVRVEGGKEIEVGKWKDEILSNHPHLEPIDIKWWHPRSVEKSLQRHYTDILADEARRAKARNQKVRDELKTDGYNDAKRRTPVYLIDNAEDTYGEYEMWVNEFRPEPPSKDDIKACYLLVSRHVSASGSRVVLPPDRRIELLPMHDGGPRQLLSVTETQEMVKKWAEARTPRATCTDDVGEFVHAQTAGHAGIVYDLLKETLDVKCSDGSLNPHYDAQRFRQILDDQFWQSLMHNGSKSLWTRLMESRIRVKSLPTLKEKNAAKFKDLTMEDIREGAVAVAREHDGYEAREGARP
ncbi:MAG: hypothetical protein L6R38_000939 [Xanthoria sp. 2 TBL-2021]|nr:MAG: hypothetical protein L6R38_000939 [Xanthoria sp. 2 TBL-2021]